MMLPPSPAPPPAHMQNCHNTPAWPLCSCSPGKARMPSALLAQCGSGSCSSHRPAVNTTTPTHPPPPPPPPGASPHILLGLLLSAVCPLPVARAQALMHLPAHLKARARLAPSFHVAVAVLSTSPTCASWRREHSLIVRSEHQ